MMDSGNLVPQTAGVVGSGGARPRTTQTQEDAQFRQKLRHMGKCMIFLPRTLLCFSFQETNFKYIPVRLSRGQKSWSHL